MKLLLDITNDIGANLPTKEKISRAIKETLAAKKMVGNFEIGLKIVSLEKIKKINSKFRKINAPTDVLSFPIHKKVPQKNIAPILLGDIILCYEVMQKNAQILGVSPEQEFIKLVRHSVLHLLGFHHRT